MSMVDETKVKDVFAKHIMKLRKNRHMTQGDFAELLGVGVSTVSDWETGKKLPRAGAIENLSRLFNVSKSSLFEEEDENKNSTPLANEKEPDAFELDVEKWGNDKIAMYKGKVLTEEQKQMYAKLVKALFED